MLVRLQLLQCDRLGERCRELHNAALHVAFEGLCQALVFYHRVKLPGRDLISGQSETHVKAFFFSAQEGKVLLQEVDLVFGHVRLQNGELKMTGDHSALVTVKRRLQIDGNLDGLAWRHASNNLLVETDERRRLVEAADLHGAIRRPSLPASVH